MMNNVKKNNTKEETKVETRPTIIKRVTTIPTPSGVFSGWGPKAA